MAQIIKKKINLDEMNFRFVPGQRMSDVLFPERQSQNFLAKMEFLILNVC